ncbi:hypothetical protein CRE_07459 [Caenorhabditis remanei]|uniref:Phospholipase A2 domain-containing protein n=1 Tax=Caenorhabditis remanei TaxID=31234 RepID=E3M2N4_CAERE|nr:hypothetical protein CRE_07459 [Caenorhabditis remanei]
MRIHLSLILLSFVVTSYSWECGIGAISSKISWLIAAPFDKRYVNSCCKQHDRHYEQYQCGRGYYTKEEADDIFCNCLNNSNSWWTRWITKPIFCAAVRMHRWFQSRFIDIC